MFLTWALCHSDGREKGWFVDRSNGEVTIEHNGQRTATVTVSLEERLYRRVKPGRSRLKVFCHPRDDDPDSVLIFNGLIQQPRALGSTAEIPAVDQSSRLLKASPAPFPRKNEISRETWAPLNLEQSALMMELIERSDARALEIGAADPLKLQPPTLGIIAGELANTRVSRRSKLNDAVTTWDALVAISERDGGPDFELEPLDREDDVHARLNTFFPRQGEDRTDTVILEYGVNLSDFAYEPSGVDLANRYVVVGSGNGTRPVYVAENRQSIRRRGVWQPPPVAIESSEMETLERAAKAYVAHHAFPINFVDAAPVAQVGGQAVGFQRNALGEYTPLNRDSEWQIPPRFGPHGSGDGYDYWIGDTITVRAKDQFLLYVDRDQPGPATDMLARVMSATYREIDKDNNVLVTHELAPVVPRADVIGYESAIRTDSI